MIVQRYNPNRLSFERYFPAAAHVQTTPSSPVRLVIPSVGIDTPVEQIDHTNDWNISTSSIHHLSSSPAPSEVGNSIMFGHNWPMLLGPLVNIKPGSQIQVHSSSGKVSIFEVIATDVVDPHETEVLRQTDDFHLTLYTCVGFLDSKRFVVSAVLRS
jgi:LPXTG-site transpeptidase (sortase) family protein